MAFISGSASHYSSAHGGEATGVRGGDLGDPIEISSSSSEAGPDTKETPKLPPIYHRKEDLKLEDPALAAEMAQIGIDPAAPLAPLRLAELPSFAIEPSSRYLEVPPQDLGIIGMLYPNARFAVCRLPTTSNQTLTFTGETLSRISQIVHNEPPRPSGRPTLFGVNLIRRDWPSGAVVRLPDVQRFRDLVGRIAAAFHLLPDEREVMESQAVEPDADGLGPREIKWARAFRPAEGNGNLMAGDDQKKAWFDEYDGGRPTCQAQHVRMTQFAKESRSDDAVGERESHVALGRRRRARLG